MKSEKRLTPSTTKSTSIKFLFACQCIHLCIIVAFYVHSLYRLRQLGDCVSDVKQASHALKYIPRKRREAVTPLHPDDLSQWTILLGHDTIIPVIKAAFIQERYADF